MLTVSSEANLALNVLHLIKMIHPKRVNNTKHKHSFKLAHILAERFLLRSVAVHSKLHQIVLNVVARNRFHILSGNIKLTLSVKVLVRKLNDRAYVPFLGDFGNTYIMIKRTVNRAFNHTLYRTADVLAVKNCLTLRVYNLTLLVHNLVILQNVLT